MWPFAKVEAAGKNIGVVDGPSVDDADTSRRYGGGLYTKAEANLIRAQKIKTTQTNLSEQSRKPGALETAERDILYWQGIVDLQRAREAGDL